MATAMEPCLDGEEDLLDDLRPKSPYGEPLGKFHVTTEWPQPLPRSRHARRPRADPRYRTQPVTFDEIREVDEDAGLAVRGVGPPRAEVAAGSAADPRPARLAVGREDQHHRRITELTCPVKLEALNAAIQKIMKRPAEVPGAQDGDPAPAAAASSHARAPPAAAAETV